RSVSSSCCWRGSRYARPAGFCHRCCTSRPCCLTPWEAASAAEDFCLHTYQISTRNPPCGGRARLGATRYARPERGGLNRSADQAAGGLVSSWRSVHSPLSSVHDWSQVSSLRASGLKRSRTPPLARSSAASETNLQGTITSVLSGRRNTNPWTVRQRRMHTTRPLPSFISTPSRSSRNRSEAMSTRCPSEVLLGATPGVLRPRGTSGVQVHAGLLYLPLSGGIRFGPLRILRFQLGDQGAGSLFGVHLSLQRLDPSVVGFEQR